MEEAKHALLGASSSHRWLQCTPSALAESAYPDKTSDFAEEGTLAHAMGARLLKQQTGANTTDEDNEIAELAEKWHTGEMDEYVDGYVAFVNDRLRAAKENTNDGTLLPPELKVEQRLNYGRWVPGGFGTGDAVIVGDGVLEIIDLKYGKGVEVSADHNTQMMLYALGAVDAYDYLYTFDEVTMTIYQPRIGNVSTWSIKIRDLMRWADEELFPLAKLAAVGKGVRNSGPWCRFCRAKADCARLASECMDLWHMNSESDAISADDLPRILERLDTVKDWLKAVEEGALARALKGETVPGWKVVAGRSIRKITDPEGAATALLEYNGGIAEEVYRPKELRTLTDLEKTFGKAKIGKLLSPYITKPQGKPTLVPESDKRAAMDDFSGIEI